jgi:hypothetical protein
MEESGIDFQRSTLNCTGEDTEPKSVEGQRGEWPGRLGIGEEWGDGWSRRALRTMAEVITYVVFEGSSEEEHLQRVKTG